MLRIVSNCLLECTEKPKATETYKLEHFCYFMDVTAPKTETKELEIMTLLMIS